jgi:hypothetical protein
MGPVVPTIFASTPVSRVSRRLHDRLVILLSAPSRAHRAQAASADGIS